MVDKATNNKLRILGLYRSNLLAQFHAREMAKLLQKSHVTLLPHLRDLETENVLSSRQSGKNKVYALNLDNLLAKNYLLLSEIFESILYLEQVFLIKKINVEIARLDLSGTMVLFGSYAKKTFTDESDIDLFYLGNLSENEVSQIKAVGKTYGQIINIKTSTPKQFEAGLRKKDFLITEIVKNHLILSNPDNFVNALWRNFYESRR